MKNHFYLILFFVVGHLFAQQPYYNDVNLNLTGMALKSALATKITTTHTNQLNYTPGVWEALRITDLVPTDDTRVYLVYGWNDNDSDITNDLTRDKNNNGGGTGQWNREHTYPQSLGTPELGQSGPGADAHMLRASDVQLNGTRGNRTFADATGNAHTVGSASWYPGDQWKGDMARIMMYMYLRYGSQCLPDGVGVGNPVSNDTHMIDLFLEWNVEDPVSQYEMNRNTYLANASNTYGQGNRNPFIDNPHLATRIWGGPVAPDTWGIYLSHLDNLLASLRIYPNPAHDHITIDNPETVEIDYYEIYSTVGQKVQTGKVLQNQIELENLSNGVYYLNLITPHTTSVEKIIVDK